jgi:dTDP-4-amino-4,6-dideoxygalactose transaminase
MPSNANRPSPQTQHHAPAIPVLDLSPEINSLWDELNAAIQRVLKSGQFILGPEVKAFEEEVAAYLGVRHAIGVNSGTDALIIGLRALGIGPGDEVITTPFSFFATAESISNVGAKPVFVDVEEGSFNIDPGLIEAKITPGTRAIMPVHLFGRPCATEAVMAIAERHRLKVIEDCAQSFGARYQGRQTGAIGDVGAFSFFPSKNLGAYGDGGLITTNDDRLAELARMLRTHGSKKKYHNELLGYNSRLDSLQAAILRVKLPHTDTWNEQRREVVRRYNQLLADVPGVITPEVTDGHVFHQYTIRLSANRDEVQARLERQGISTMVYYPIPQDRLPVYHGQYPANPVSDRLARQVLSLPIWPSLSAECQERVTGALQAALQPDLP